MIVLWTRPFCFRLQDRIARPATYAFIWYNPQSQQATFYYSVCSFGFRLYIQGISLERLAAFVWNLFQAAGTPADDAGLRYEVANRAPAKNRLRQVPSLCARKKKIEKEDFSRGGSPRRQATDHEWQTLDLM